MNCFAIAIAARLPMALQLEILDVLKKADW
jgi:hypothetical protein